ncbi:MAG: sialidase family protein, partial [Fibrobacteria bacterium]
MPLLPCLLAAALALDRDLAVLSEERIGAPSTAYNHASTLAEAADGSLVAAWYGGSAEGADDVSIWASRKDGSGWSPIVEVDDGRRDDGLLYACWNPVLLTAHSGVIFLFYKISSRRAAATLAGYQNWWGCFKTSTDHGRSWSARQWLPSHESPIFANFGKVMTGPVKNKPLELPDGSLLSGSSTEAESWQTHVEIGAAGNWTGSIALAGPLRPAGAIQPAFLVLSPDYRNLRMLCRPQTGNNPFTAVSSDMGRTWSALTRVPGLETSVGLDALTLENGWHLLAHNLPPNRYPLVLSRSRDGITWEKILPDLSVRGTLRMDYPAMIQTRDGRVHV